MPDGTGELWFGGPQGMESGEMAAVAAEAKRFRDMDSEALGIGVLRWRRMIFRKRARRCGP